MKAEAQQARIALLPACLVAIIVGIIGMHVINQNGEMPSPNTGHHAAAAVAAEMSVAHPAAADVAPLAGHDATTTLRNTDTSTVPTANDSARSMSDMVMLCAAMLLGAAGSVLLAMRLRRVFASIGLNARQFRRVTASLVSPRAGTGPPYVWEFSAVIRC